MPVAAVAISLLWTDLGYYPDGYRRRWEEAFAYVKPLRQPGEDMACFSSKRTPVARYYLETDDCDDKDNQVHPGAQERQNCMDDDCDDRVDEGIPWTDGVNKTNEDRDGDGVVDVRSFYEDGRLARRELADEGAAGEAIEEEQLRSEGWFSDGDESPTTVIR